MVTSGVETLNLEPESFSVCLTCYILKDDEEKVHVEVASYFNRMGHLVTLSAPTTKAWLLSPWSSQSLNLNPIEPLWEEVKTL